MNSVIKEKKYILRTFNSDGQRIHPQALLHLYGLNRWECVIITGKASEEMMLRGIHNPDKLIQLGIRPNGDYIEHLQKLLAVREIFSSIGD